MAYISGFLAFREIPLIKEVIKELTIKPDIYLFDGMDTYIIDTWVLLHMLHFI